MPAEAAQLARRKARSVGERAPVPLDPTLVRDSGPQMFVRRALPKYPAPNREGYLGTAARDTVNSPKAKG